jgi:hypothetical protein
MAEQPQASAGPICGVIIPARDEAARIGRCLAALHDGLPAGFARIVVACNGCRDGTAEIARTYEGPDLQVLDLSEGGKAKAIREAERLLPESPRFYLDADVEFRGHDLVQLAGQLATGPWHLVSPTIVHERTECGPGAAALSRVWLALPHARESAFHHVLGVSTEGRRRWDEFPLIIADDAFIAARFLPQERRIDPDIRVMVHPPRTVAAWIGVRTRWLEGERELNSLGLGESAAKGRASSLIRLALRPSMLPGVTLHVAVRILARLRVRRPGSGSHEWYRDATTRR